MEIKANDYEASEILKYIRETTNLSQKQFANSIGKSKDWCQSNELGRTNFYFKDLLKLANLHNIEIIIKEKNNQKKS